MDSRSAGCVTWSQSRIQQLKLCRPLGFTGAARRLDCLFGCWNLSLILSNKFLKSFTMLFIYWLPNIRVVILIRCILVPQSCCRCSVKKCLTVWMALYSSWPIAFSWSLLCCVPAQAPCRALLGLGSPGPEQGLQCRAVWHSSTGPVSAFLGLQSPSSSVFVLSKQMHVSKQSQISSHLGKLQLHLQHKSLAAQLSLTHSVLLLERAEMAVVCSVKAEIPYWN